MRAAAYLPVLVKDVPVDMLFSGSALRPTVAHYVAVGVVKIVAGPERCHVLIDIQRPYHRPVVPRAIEI